MSPAVPKTERGSPGAQKAPLLASPHHLRGGGDSLSLQGLRMAGRAVLAPCADSFAVAAGTAPVHEEGAVGRGGRRKQWRTEVQGAPVPLLYTSHFRIKSL